MLSRTFKLPVPSRSQGCSLYLLEPNTTPLKAFYNSLRYFITLLNQTAWGFLKTLIVRVFGGLRVKRESV